MQFASLEWVIGGQGRLCTLLKHSMDDRPYLMETYGCRNLTQKCQWRASLQLAMGRHNMVGCSEVVFPHPCDGSVFLFLVKKNYVFRLVQAIRKRGPHPWPIYRRGDFCEHTGASHDPIRVSPGDWTQMEEPLPKRLSMPMLCKD